MMDLVSPSLPTTLAISPPAYTGALIGSPLASWNVAQWGTRTPLAVVAPTTSEGFRLYAEDASVKLLRARDGRWQLELFQTSQHPDYGSRECDLFVQPNSVSVYPQAVPGFRELVQPISTMSHLRVQCSHEVVVSWAGTRAPDNLSNTIIGFSFVNKETTPWQALFYQLCPYDSRGGVFDGVFFYNGVFDGTFVTYGVVDSVQHFGWQPLLPGGGMVAYDLDLMPRIVQLINTRPPNIDVHLAHWRLQGVFLGSLVTGEAWIRSRMGAVSVCAL